MPIDDDDLFDPPTPKRAAKPSNKIVFQPAGATWSLDRLPEVEAFYQQTFKKRLPLANKGQGSIHNKWKYDHTNSADVSLNPSTPEGKQFEAKLREMGVPFLAFTGAIPGVATGPHYHLGFPSRKTDKKFNVGAQRKKESLASDDLFDSQTDDNDLFDQMQGQTPPISPRVQTPEPAISTARRSAPSTRFGVPQDKRYSRPLRTAKQPTVFDQAQASVTGARQPSLAGQLTVLPGVHRVINLLPDEERENLAEGTTGAVAGTIKQLANAQDLGMQITGAKALGIPNPVTPLIRRGGQAVENAVAENAATRPEPTTFTGQVRRGVGRGAGAAAIELPKLILGGSVLKAANLPIQGSLSRADEGLPGIIKGAAGGLVYHYGGALTGKYLGKLGNSLVWIAGPTAEQQVVPRLYNEEAPPLGQSLGENIPIGVFAGASGARKRKAEPVQVREGNTTRPATEADLPKIASREIEVVPPAVEAAERRSIRREFDKIKETEAPQRFQHIQFGEVEVLADQSGARPGRLRIAEVTDPTKQHFVKKSDAQGRGNARMIPIKEPSLSAEGEVEGAGGRGATESPALNIPERPETIQAQLESRGFSLIPKGTPRPSLPQGYRAEKTVDGVVYYDPKRIDAETIRSTPTTELLGHVESKSETTSEAVVARTPEGTELHSSAVSPGNLQKQIEATKANFPAAKIEAGGPELAAQVIQERVIKDQKPRGHQVNTQTMSLAQAVRVAGGLRFDKSLENRGEVSRLSNKEGATSGLVNNRSGHAVEDMARAMAEQGYTGEWLQLIPDPSGRGGLQKGKIDVDPNKFIEAVENDLRDVKKSWSMERDVDYEQEYSKHLETPQMQDTQRKWEAFETDGNTRDLYERLMYNGAEDLTQAELSNLRAKARKHGIADELEDSIESNYRLGDAAEPRGEVDTSFNFGERPATPDVLPQRPQRPPAQLGFVQEGLESQTVQPKRDLSIRDRLISEEQSRQKQSVSSVLGDKADQLEVLSDSSFAPVRIASTTLWQRVKQGRVKNTQGASDLIDVLDTLEHVSKQGLTVEDYIQQRGLFGESNVNKPLLRKVAGLKGDEARRFVDSYLSQGDASEPSWVSAARERQANRAVEHEQGIRYKQLGADPYELIDNITIRGWELYSQKVRPTFQEWSRKLREEFGVEANPHLKDVWAQLGGVPETTTSARKSQMATDRADLDLPQLPQAERKSWQDTLDRAKVRGTKNASLLADEVLSNPRSLNEVETAQLVLRAQEIKNEHSRLMKEVGDETNSESIAAKRPTLEALEREFDKLTQATKASGTEKGRALASQKLTINQDYDLVSLIQRAKAVKGRDITAEERTRYERIAAELEELKIKFAASEEAHQSKRLQKEIDRVIRRGKRAETKKELDDEFVLLSAQFAQARAQTRGIHSAGLAGLDPEGTLTPLIAKMARNRVRAGVVKAEDVVDQVYEAVSQHVGGITKRDVRDVISGYGLERKGKPRAEDVKQLAAIRSELKKLSAQEDIEAGRRLTSQEKTRQTQLLKQEADLQRRLLERDFETPERNPLVYNRETQALANRVNKLKGEYERELYRAQRGKLGVAWDIGVNVANVPKSLKSMGDVSAVLRQGGYFSITHPVLSTKAGIDMLRSFSDTGFRNVEREIQAHKDFDLAKRSGVEFTGLEKDNPNLSKREEAYLGSDIIDRASETPVVGKAVAPVKAVKDFSERTFVSFLDSQRMQVFSRFADHVRSLKMSPKEEARALKAMGQFVNIGTGRGSLGKSGNQIAPALNVLMFSPRLLASRVQLMNKMVNPVAIKRMPKGARSLMIKDNVKFAGTIATALGLAKAAGAGVSLDPDDADFLKIRIGNSHYDILTGLQQPMRFIYRMARAVQADITGDETYAGESKSALADRFRRSKAAPLAGGIETYIRNEDFKGRKFKLSRELVELVTPLYINDFKEAMEEDGVVGALVKTSPALIGVGAQTYKDAPEKPRTHAEKLARKFVRAKMPDNARTEEQVDIDQTKANLRAKSRRGEDVTKELNALGAKVTSRQVKSILDARDKTRLQEDVNKLSALDAVIVWSVMNPGQRAETKSILEHKATLIDNLPEDQQEPVRRRYKDAGIEAVAKKKPGTRFTGFKSAFQRRSTQFATAP